MNKDNYILLARKHIAILKQFHFSILEVITMLDVVILGLIRVIVKFTDKCVLVVVVGTPSLDTDDIVLSRLFHVGRVMVPWDGFLVF